MRWDCEIPRTLADSQSYMLGSTIMSFSWLQLVIDAGAIGVLATLVGFLGREWIAATFRKNVTSHAERLKYDLQKSMLDLERAAERRHVIYAKIYEHLVKSDGAVFSLRGIRFSRTYEDCNREDIVKILGDIEGPSKPKEEILQTWDTDSRSGIDALKKYLLEYETNLARESQTNAKNYWRTEELYVSKTVSNKVHEVLSNQFALFHEYTNPNPSGNEQATQIKTYKTNARNGLDELLSLMQLEIGVELPRETS